jgi:hypothetical protein
MATIMSGNTRSWKLGATMFTVFGALALVLAAIGLYSVIAYNVTQRTHEMGVRVALGAQARDVIRLIVREGLTIVLPGIVLGGAIALFAGKWVAPLLFEVSAEGSLRPCFGCRNAGGRRGGSQLGSGDASLTRRPERGVAGGLASCHPTDCHPRSTRRGIWADWQ